MSIFFTISYGSNSTPGSVKSMAKKSKVQLQQQVVTMIPTAKHL